MFLRALFIVLSAQCLMVICLPPAPAIYRKAELALNHYMSSSSHNPMTHSLLNILIHDKYAKAFTTDQAIEMALSHIKDFDKKTKTHNEVLFRDIIYGLDCDVKSINCTPTKQAKHDQPSPALVQHIVSELDKYFPEGDSNEYSTDDTDGENKA